MNEVTAEFPPGSKVIIIETQGAKQVKVGILPDGEIVIPEDTTATIYEKPPILVT